MSASSCEELGNDRFGATQLLDARDLLCPEPVMLLHKKVRAADAGEVIKLLATDGSTERDVPRFCEFLQHPLLGQEFEQGVYSYWIKKRDAT